MVYVLRDVLGMPRSLTQEPPPLGGAIDAAAGAGEHTIRTALIDLNRKDVGIVDHSGVNRVPVLYQPSEVFQGR